MLYNRELEDYKKMDARATLHKVTFINNVLLFSTVNLWKVRG